MTESTPKSRFLTSVDRCTEDERFLSVFYGRFLASSDDVRAKFRHTDFDKQASMLKRSLRLCAGATVGDRAALAEIKERTRTHDRDHLDVEPRLYSLWLESLVTTAAEFDPHWSADVESAWRRILGHVIDHMTRHY